MISFLFSMILVPWLPELDDPKKTHATAIATIESRLSDNFGDPFVNPPGQAPLNPATTVTAPVPNILVSSVETLPSITGRLFEWSNREVGEPDPFATVDLAAKALRLTGLIDSAGQKVAILSDGEEDHVVGLGSYVLGAYKVAAFGPGRVVLVRIDSREGEKRLELNLMREETSGGLQ